MKPISNVNDNHKVLVDWQAVKDAVAQVDKEFLKFYGPTKTKKAGIRARKRLMKMIYEIHVIREKLLKQRQDYDSEY
jgi:hypothetical protein